MRAMILRRTISLSQTDAPLELVELPVPTPCHGELLLRVAACGVCHTELDEIEGRTAPPQLPIILGHEVVGYVAAVTNGVTQHRVGVGWIHHSSGDLQENLSDNFCATGRDVHSGYADHTLNCNTAPGSARQSISPTGVNKNTFRL